MIGNEGLELELEKSKVKATRLVADLDPLQGEVDVPGRRQLVAVVPVILDNALK